MQNIYAGRMAKTNLFVVTVFQGRLIPRPTKSLRRITPQNPAPEYPTVGGHSSLGASGHIRVSPVLHDPAVVDGFVSGLHEIIQWLTGYSKEEIDRSIEENLTFEQFFASANLNKNATLIKGIFAVMI